MAVLYFSILLISRLFQAVFQITPLNLVEWMAVMKISIPVVLLDETLKFVARKFTDGKHPLSRLYMMIPVWVIYIALCVYGPI
jgi:Ca2+ transporting ATPase